VFKIHVKIGLFYHFNTQFTTFYHFVDKINVLTKKFIVNAPFIRRVGCKNPVITRVIEVKL